MKHRVEKLTGAANEASPAAPYLNAITPSKRAMALFLHEVRTDGSTMDEFTARVTGYLGLDPETDSEDFRVARELRDKALGRLLDADVIQLATDLSRAWSAPMELIISESLRAWAKIRPEPGQFDVSVDALSNPN